MRISVTKRHFEQEAVAAAAKVVVPNLGDINCMEWSDLNQKWMHQAIWEYGRIKKHTRHTQDFCPEELDDEIDRFMTKHNMQIYADVPLSLEACACFSDDGTTPAQQTHRQAQHICPACATAALDYPLNSRERDSFVKTIRFPVLKIHPLELKRYLRKLDAQIRENVDVLLADTDSRTKYDQVYEQVNRAIGYEYDYDDDAQHAFKVALWGHFSHTARGVTPTNTQEV